MSEPWRWAGALVGRNINPESEVFAWVRAVSAAIVAGLVMRMLVFPSGALTDVSLALRGVALFAGLAGYFLTGRRLGLGIASGLVVLLAGMLFKPRGWW